MNKGLRQRLSQVNRRAAGTYALVALLAFGLGAVMVRSCAHSEPGSRSAKQTAAADSAATKPDAIWTCAMHPQIRQPNPGACPICGMDLIPAESNNSEETRPERVTLSERAKALAQLRTSVVRRMADPSAELRLLGRIVADETNARVVTAWVGGRIERLLVRVTGEKIRAGQTIATLYSPEVLAAHQDLIAAKRQVARMQSATEMARLAAEAALEAARERLRLLGVSDERVRAMEAEDKPSRQIAIQSPFGGTIIERVATEGSYVSTGEPLYRIANLSTVWVQLDAYERDLPLLQVGQKAQISVEGMSGEAFEGKLAFIDPVIEPQRRTAQLRVEVANRQGRLRPGMFAQAVVQGRTGTTAERPLVVPDTAPLFTGRRSVVYVEVPDTERPTYESRIVRLGPRAGDVYPVVAGLAEGERIVTRGAFVLDADLQIRGGTSMMVGPDDSHEGPWDRVIELSTSERRKLRPLAEAYLELQKALAADDLSLARKAAAALAKDAARVNLGPPQSAKEAWPPLARELGQHAQHIAHADSLEKARGTFESLSAQIQALLQRFGNPLDRPLRLAFCPMAAGNGASWIQEGKEIDNSYFGAAMRACGEIRETVAPNAYLLRQSAPKPTSASAPAASGGHQH